MLYNTKSILGIRYKPRLFFHFFSCVAMLCAGVLNTFQERISNLETEIHRKYKRRDDFKFGTKEWFLCQADIDNRLKRLRYLKTVYEKMCEETLPAATWGFTSHAA